MRSAIVFPGFVFPSMIGLLLLTPSAHGQTAEAPLSFEVATVKPTTRNFGMNYTFKGGPGSHDPGRYSIESSLHGLLLTAMGLKVYQFSEPEWLDSEAFVIEAKLPGGATKEELDTMLRNLLLERFNVTFHHETKVMPIYELTVGKGGSRLKESDLTQQPAPRDPRTGVLLAGTDAKGFPMVRPGASQLMGRVTDGIMRWTSVQAPISRLADALERNLDRPVIDKTGLAGRYDFPLAYSQDGLKPLPGKPAANETSGDDTPSGGPSIFKAVQEQLGLKLESAKDPVDIFVLDHIDKLPSKN